MAAPRFRKRTSPPPPKGWTPPYLTVSARKKEKRTYRYVVVRYDEIHDDGTKQPKPLVSLGPEESVDRAKAETLTGVMREFVRKGSTMTVEELKAHLGMAKPKLRILCSRQFGLRLVVEQAFKELGYSEALKAIDADSRTHFSVERAVFAMVLQQIVSPGSKLRAAERLGDVVFFPEGEGLSVDHLYRALDVLAKNQDVVEAALRTELTKHGISFDKLAHDTTSSFFRTDYDDVEWKVMADDERAERQRAPTINEPPLRMRGHSKDHQPGRPQIVVEAVTAEGFVVHHETHPGNRADKSVLAATAKKAVDELGFAKGATWTGDTGMNSGKAQDALDELGLDWVLGEGRARTDEVREVIAAKGEFTQHPDNVDLAYRAEKRGEKLFVVRLNRLEQKRRLKTIERHLARVRLELGKDDLVSGHGRRLCGLLSHKTYGTYVRKKPDDATRLEVDPDAVALQREIAGRSVISSKLDDPLEIDAIYRRLYEVEGAFRTLKGELDLRPIRHRKAPRIRAHVLLCVMSLNIVRWIERKTEKRLPRLRDILTPICAQRIEVGGSRFWESVELSEEQAEVFEKLGYEKPLKRFEAVLAETP
jgi:transposase